MTISAYLNTRVSLFAARLLTPRQFDELVDCPDAELPEWLLRHGLDTMVRNSGDDPSAEQRIGAALLREIAILARPLRGGQRGFIDDWTRRYEISNLKSLIRGKLMQQRPAEIAASMIDLGHFARLPIEQLLHVEDLPELLGALEHTVYKDLARSARQTVEMHRDPFMLDAMLDKCYYEGLIGRVRPLEMQEGEDFRSLIGDMIDRINLMWLIRFRFNYGLPPAQAYFLLVHAPYHLRSELLQGLARQPDLAALRSALPRHWRSRLDGAETPIQVFAALEEDSIVFNQRLLRHSSSAMTRVIAYIQLRERCLRRVLAVVRGRRLAMATPTIRHAVHLEEQAMAVGAA
ncbi:MAG: V-type ATPase subunit [Gammaproteobacteria bacterium]|nr:V-type ATPase subunit [Gammaproteobacteria bacterium]